MSRSDVNTRWREESALVQTSGSVGGTEIFFRGSPRACTTSQPWMNSFRCVSDRLLITNIWIGERELSFPEAYGEELEVLGR